jgi:hypothetical protein
MTATVVLRITNVTNVTNVVLQCLAQEGDCLCDAAVFSAAVLSTGRRLLIRYASV